MASGSVTISTILITPCDPHARYNVRIKPAVEACSHLNVDSLTLTVIFPSMKSESKTLRAMKRSRQSFPDGHESV